MNNLFTAVDEKGKTYYFDTEKTKTGYLLTLKKETFVNAKKLYLFGELSKAKAGDTGYYVLPRNIDLVGDVQIFFKERKNYSYFYNRPVISAYGIKKEDECYYIRIERICHYGFETIIKDGVYTVTPVIDFTINDDLYFQHEEAYTDIKVEIFLLGKDAGYKEMAKIERETRLKRGEIITLKEKCENRPAVDYIRKYPIVRIRNGWKPSPSTVKHQTLENEPEMHVAVSFKRVREIADELKRQGVKGAELQLVGWNVGGHDGRFSQLFPADERLGGNKGFKETIDYVKSLGYHISTHTNAMDSYEISDRFDLNEIVKLRSGEPLQVGDYGGGLAYHICPLKQAENVKRDLPELKAYGENGVHFSDVISIIVPDACYDKAHPVHTDEAIKVSQKIMKYIGDLFGGFASEGCMDFALKYMDYGLYTTFGKGYGDKGNDTLFDRYIPFFEMCYHGIVLYNPSSDTVNFPVKEKRDRLTFVMRGGTPAMYYYSKFRTGGEKNWMGDSDLTCETEEELKYSVEKIKEASLLQEKFADKQFLFIENYEFLDNGLEILTYSDKSKVIGNPTDKELCYNGEKIESFGFIMQ